jgi:hypothetical protein
MAAPTLCPPGTNGPGYRHRPDRFPVTGHRFSKTSACASCSPEPLAGDLQRRRRNIHSDDLRELPVPRKAADQFALSSTQLQHAARPAGGQRFRHRRETLLVQADLLFHLLLAVRCFLFFRFFFIRSEDLQCGAGQLPLVLEIALDDPLPNYKKKRPAGMVLVRMVGNRNHRERTDDQVRSYV